jgi:hypothetical protein
MSTDPLDTFTRLTGQTLKTVFLTSNSVTAKELTQIVNIAKVLREKIKAQWSMWSKPVIYIEQLEALLQFIKTTPEQLLVDKMLSRFKADLVASARGRTAVENLADLTN